MTRFLSELSGVVAARAARVGAQDRDFASIDLAAHLFAAATYLRERYGDARMDTMYSAPADGMEEALAIAAALSSDDPVSAYLGACAALVGIDAACAANRLVLAPVLPARTALQTLADEDRPALFGSVQHWIRPANPWTAARDHRSWLCPKVNIYPPTPADKLEALGMVWDRGEALELRPVRCRELPHRPSGFRVALCPLLCGADPRFTVSPDGHRFTIDPANEHWDPGALAAYLAALAPVLEAADVQLLVLPELSVTAAAREQLVRILERSSCMQGIVAGSYHMWRGDDPVPWNEAVFYVPRGIALTHEKHGYFRVTDRQITRFRSLFTEPLPELKPNVVEGIRRGSALQFWDTWVGRIAVVICADAIARESLIPAIERCSPDVLILPSLSLETEIFEHMAESLARRGISVLYVNAGTVCQSTGVPSIADRGAMAAFAHLALQTPDAAPHSWVRWRHGANPEVFRYEDASWLLAPVEQVQTLGNQDGIVFDLAAHFAWRDPGSANVLGDLGTEMVQKEN